MRMVNYCSVCKKYRLVTWTNDRWLCGTCLKQLRP